MAQPLTPTPDSASSHCCGDGSCRGASQRHTGAPSSPWQGPGSPARCGEDRSWWGQLGQLLGEGCVGSVHSGNENQLPGNECSSFGLLRLENTRRRKSQRQESAAGGAGRASGLLLITGVGALRSRGSLVGSACPMTSETPALGVTGALGFAPARGCGGRASLSSPSLLLSFSAHNRRDALRAPTKQERNCGHWRFAAFCSPQKPDWTPPRQPAGYPGTAQMYSSCDSPRVSRPATRWKTVPRLSPLYRRGGRGHEVGRPGRSSTGPCSSPAPLPVVLEDGLTPLRAGLPSDRPGPG